MIRAARVAESFEAIGVMEPAQRFVPWSFVSLLEGRAPKPALHGRARRNTQKTTSHCCEPYNLPESVALNLREIERMAGNI